MSTIPTLWTAKQTQTIPSRTRFQKSRRWFVVVRAPGNSERAMFAKFLHFLNLVVNPNPVRVLLYRFLHLAYFVHTYRDTFTKAFHIPPSHPDPFYYSNRYQSCRYLVPRYFLYFILVFIIFIFLSRPFLMYYLMKKYNKELLVWFFKRVLRKYKFCNILRLQYMLSSRNSTNYKIFIGAKFSIPSYLLEHIEFLEWFDQQN